MEVDEKKSRDRGNEGQEVGMGRGESAERQAVGLGQCVTAMVGAMAMIGGFLSAGCAEQPKPGPSQKEIRSDSDRFFDRMKQDEHEHGKGVEGMTK